jgi:hypothetical protein
MAALVVILTLGLDGSNLSINARFVLFWIAFAWAGWFFLFVVILIPFRTTPDFAPNGQRLALDALLSGFSWIVVCGYYYSLVGIHPIERSTGVYDYFYFSTVTFSTLGYGDFSPEPAGRAIASIQAIVGNLHLGVLVAAAFLVAGTISNPSRGKDKGDGSNED